MLMILLLVLLFLFPGAPFPLLEHEPPPPVPTCAGNPALIAIPDPPPVTDAPTPAPVRPAVESRRCAPTTVHMLLSRNAYLEASGDGPFARSARILPRLRDGHPDGLKLYALRPGSPLRLLGLLNGDVLLDPDDLEEILQLDHDLRGEAAHVTLLVERRGCPVQLTVWLVDDAP